MSAIPRFAELAVAGRPSLDLISLALAQEFGEVDGERALAQLDALGGEVASALAGDPAAGARAVSRTLGIEHGFTGDRRDYDNPDNSMLHLVLARRRGLPILLSVVYVEVARRAGIALEPIGLEGHFIVGALDAEPPVLLDPFAGGALLRRAPADGPLRAWGAHEIAMRMLNNLLVAYVRRGDLSAAIRAAELRTLLPAPLAARARVRGELRALRARLN